VLTRRTVLLSLAALGCRRSNDGLLVFAAASTTESMTELGALFTQKHGLGVRFSFGSSGDLAKQIESGAPADLFLSADMARVDALERKGHVRSRRELLRNRLVVVVPAQSTLAKLEDAKRIAIGDPAVVPAGAYAKQWLDEVHPTVGAIVPTLDVRAALGAVETGAVDAAIVYRTDAMVGKGIRVLYEPQPQPNIIYPLAVLTRGRAEADAFAAFASGEGFDVFTKRGFLPR
jgi:molybdate transport system substrate-binding protein